MNKIKKSICFFSFPVLLANWSMAIASISEMTPLEDNDLRAVAGQGLILNDKISGSDLDGSNAYSEPFDFYRMGLNGELEMNMNISKLQLGCGGINDHLSGFAGCDIDIDYAALMGRDGTEPGAPGSPFKLTRPYIEIAVKNDDTATLREVAGIKIGGESADGAMVAGRRYTQNEAINQENTAFANSCDTGASTGAGVAGCHSGINTVSGFLGTELSITMRVQARLLGIFGLDAWGCTGRTQTNVDVCGTGRGDALFVDVAGTRMQTLGLRSAQLDLGDVTIGGFIDITPLLNSAYAQLNTDLRLAHKLTFEKTGDFFLSFQREPIAYPRYSKKTPIEELQEAGIYATAIDACAISSTQTARCSSAYSVPANTGWWLNAPSVKLMDIVNENANLGNVSLNGALDLLGAPGFLIEHPEFEMTPQQNCHGSTKFC